MPFGQIVVGPPGCGKSTYCFGMYQFLSAIGRKVSVINLDPANDHTNYDCALDIRDFVTLEEVMTDQNLGPNGGIMYAMEEIEESIDVFISRLQKLGKQEYLIFDCPGQVELFTHHSSLHKIFKKLEKLDYRLVVVSLVDSFYITSPSQYISVILLALRTMMMLDLPHINVFSKIDLLSSYGKLDFNLNYYTEVQDLTYLEESVENESNVGKKYSELTKAIAEVIGDFGLVNFEVLAVEDKQSMINLLSVIDKANGYVFGATEIGGDTVWAEATRQGGYSEMAIDIQDRWIDNKQLYDEEEEKRQQELIKEAEELNKPISAEEDWENALKEWESGHNAKFQR